MSRIEEIKERIKEIQVEADNIKKELEIKNNSIYDLEQELNKEVNRSYIDFCTKVLNGNYFHHTFSKKDYIYDLYIYVEKVQSEHDGEDYIIYGRSIMLVYYNNNGERGKLVTTTIDVDSQYMVTNEWGDSLSGYLAYDTLVRITKEDFKRNKDKINEINI